MTNAYGCLPKTPDDRDYLCQVAAPFAGQFVDLSPLFPQKPYDQLQLGSCVSNGTAAAADFARAKAGLAPLGPPSRLFIYYQGRLRSGQPLGQDTGLQIRDGFTVVSKDGAPPEADWPYDPAKFTEKPPAHAYADAKHDVATVFGAVPVGSIDAVIAAGHPVVLGFTVYASFESSAVAQTGVMPIPKAGERVLGGHCVVAVSTPKDGKDIPHGIPGVAYRKCRNSWGHDGTWGCPDDPGHFWMPVSFMESSDASDFWQVTTMSDPLAPVPPKPGPVASFPGTLVAAAQALGSDPAVTAFLTHHAGKKGPLGEVADLIGAVLAAPRA